MHVDHARWRGRTAAGWCAVLFLVMTAGCRSGGERSRDDDSAAHQTASGRASLDAGAATTDTTAAAVDAPITADAAPVPAAGDLAASVNAQTISLADFQMQALDTQRYFVDKGLDPNTDAGQRQLLALRRQVLGEMIDQALIEQAAASRGITATNQEVETSLAAYRQQAGGSADFDAARAATGATEAEVFAMERQAIVGRKFVEDISRDLPTAAPFVHARHILCRAEADCSAALARLEAGEDFATVAADVSQDEVSAAQGGDLGWIPIITGLNYLPSAELEAVIAGLDAGQRSGVVKTDYGFHVVEVTEIDPSRDIDAELGFKLREKRVQDWLAEQRRTGDIVIYIDDLKDALGTEG